MKTKIELIEIEEIINSIQNENELFNKIMPFIKSVEKITFMNSKFTGTFDCKKLQTVGTNAFYSSEFTGSFDCPELLEVGNQTFYMSKFTGTFNCPNLTLIGQYAFVNSNFDTITIGAKAILNRGCIGAHSDEFINDYEANGKLAGTYVWNGEHWTGTYVWNGEHWTGTYVWNGEHWIYQK